MTTALVRYDEARRALAAAHRVDEVKSIRDKAEAMAAYARQAKDTAMVEWATEIKVRAERRCGELLRDSAKNGARAKKGKPSEMSKPATLSDIGLTRDQSSRYQQLAAMPEKHFEATVATAKETVGQVTSAFMLRAARRMQPTKKRSASPSRDEPLDEPADMEPTPKEYQNAFWTRVDAALGMARYGYHERGLVDKQMVESARACASAWSELAKKLEARL